MAVERARKVSSHELENTGRATQKEPLAVEIGKRLRQARIRAEFSREAVAELLGFDRQTIGTWENGFSYPPIKRLRDLCRLYRVSIDEIVNGTEPDSWEGVAALMPLKLRQQTFILARRPDIGELAEELDHLDGNDFEKLAPLLKQISKLNGKGLDWLTSMLKGLGNLIES